MNKRTKNILIVLLVAELLLIYLYYHYQPKCNPCNIEPCPPCISKEQKVIRGLFFVPLLVALIMIIYKKLKHNKATH
jgi:hypothetical protein